MPPLTRKDFRQLLPFRIVVDACVFPQTKRWIIPILDAAKAGYVTPYWSPLIIAESNRVLTWLWLKRHGREFTDRSWRECSADFKKMFAHLTEVFQVIDDRPPAPQTWDRPSDPWDIPIWTAAKRCEATFVITDNLADAPPENVDGLQVFDGVYFVHPDEFLLIIEAIADVLEMEDLPEARGDGVDNREGIPLVYHPFLDELFRRKLGSDNE